MQNISTSDLDLVFGGTGSDKPAIPGSASSGSGSSGLNGDQLLTAIQGIQSSLKDINKNNNGGLFGNNGMLFLGMAMAMSRRSEVVVYGGRHGYGYSWRSGW